MIKLSNEADVIRMCLCLKDYICNYPFYAGVKYPYIKHQSLHKTLLDKEGMESRKTFSTDNEFEEFFLDIDVEEKREQKINMVL
jgi:hypothetical protein